MGNSASGRHQLTGDSKSAHADGVITTRQWLISLAVAGAIHLYALGVFPSASAEGAEGLGEMGIEVDLGMIGDMGEWMETLEMSQPVAAPPPEEVPEETIEPPVAEPEPEPPKEKPKPIVRAKPEKPAATFRAALDLRRPEPFVETPPKRSEAKTVAQNRPAPRSLATAKLSTGQAQAQTTGGNPEAERSYIALLAAKLRRQKHYPLAARRAKDEGEVTLFLQIDRQGQVLEARISKRSGIPSLDAAVLRMLEKAKPLPPFFPDMPQSQLAVNIPVTFRLDQVRY